MPVEPSLLLARHGIETLFQPAGRLHRVANLSHCDFTSAGLRTAGCPAIASFARRHLVGVEASRGRAFGRVPAAGVT